MKSRFLGGVAHLLGHVPGKGAAADDDGEKKPKDEKEKAEGGGAEPAAEGEGGDKAAGEGGEKDEKEAGADEDDKKEAVATARKEGATAERTRIASILTCDAAHGRGDLALHLALETDMTAEQATKTLAASPMQGKGQLGRAMASVPNPPAGPGGKPSAASGDGWGEVVDHHCSSKGMKPLGR